MLALIGLRLGAAAVVLVLASAAIALEADNPESQELIFFLQYVGSDYGAAVRNDKVADAAEYREVLDLSERIVERYQKLRPRGSARPDLLRLHELIRRRAPWDAVRALSRELVPRIADELDVATYPAEPPDLDRGRALYGEDCAPCHGVAGGGDGHAAPELTPKPTSFRDPAVAMLSPHQVFGATNFGVPGTGMPAYREALTPREAWNVAFFVMTLRSGFDPSRPVEVVPLSLAELASRSDEELLKSLRASRPGALASELDYYRAQFRRSEPKEVLDLATAGDNGLEVAELLQNTFARVADKVYLSVVGISLYEKDTAPQPARTGWTEGDTEERLYPGFHRTRAGTGFVVGGDGDILTYAGAVAHPGSGKSSVVIDVELPGNVHCRAKVIGIEPTIDLAVLGIVAPVPVRPVTIGNSDDVRVGHWAIAVGDPPGPERTFAPGTIAARPERECYQEHRTSTLLQSSVAIDTAGLGGPLVNIHGEVVGLTLASPGNSVESPSAASRPVSALPINLAMTIYRALKVKESEQSPWIGISVLDLSAKLRHQLKSSPLTGIYIDDVFAPSPASRAGIHVGDILTKMDDHPILGVSDFQTWLYLLGIDAPVTLEIFRDGGVLRKSVVIEQRPETARMR
jgi:serine protease Do